MQGDSRALWEALVLGVTGADAVQRVELVQSLWSGYGEILRVSLQGGGARSVVVKHVSPPNAANHPRGWNTDRSRERKLRSYEVEAHWYSDWAGACDDSCRVPQCLALEARDDGWVMVLEDLDAEGFPLRKQRLSEADISACLSWLANFHAEFMCEEPEGLWPVGTYWHLETRPDEWDAMPDSPLKAAAAALDARLNRARYKTLVHGDAKVANFCFAAQGAEVAAVDFQYVGGGCGMKDVAYFLGSCLDEDQLEKQEMALLDEYFAHLREALDARISLVDTDELEAEWRELFPIAWTDFYRFLEGWMPGHAKAHRYTRALAEQVLTS